VVIAGRPKTVGAIANPSATHAAQLPFTHELLLVRMRTFCHVTASLTRSTELKTATVFRPALTTAVTVLCAGLSACAYLPPDDCSPHHEYCGHPHTGNPSYPSKNPPPRAHRPPPDMHQDMRPHHRPQQPDARPAPHTPPRQDYRDDRRPPPPPSRPSNPPPRHDARPEPKPAPGTRPPPPPQAPQQPSQYQDPELSREQIDAFKNAIRRLPNHPPSQEQWRP
jgi:hypothetical protein